MDLIWGNSFVLSELFSSMVGPDVLNGKLIKALINLMLEIELRNLKLVVVQNLFFREK